MEEDEESDDFEIFIDRGNGKETMTVEKVQEESEEESEEESGSDEEWEVVAEEPKTDKYGFVNAPKRQTVSNKPAKILTQLDAMKIRKYEMKKLHENPHESQMSLKRKLYFLLYC